MEDLVDPNALITALPISKYQTIGDIGAGKGYFSIPLAKYVYDGRLYAIDTDKDMLECTRSSADKNHLQNIETIVSKKLSIPLESEILDGAITSNVLQYSGRPKMFLKEVARLVKKGGWLAILEWDSSKERVTPEQMLTYIEDLGLRYTVTRTLRTGHYAMLLRKAQT